MRQTMSLPGFSTSLRLDHEAENGANGGLRSRGLLHGKQVF